tara:strand:- start:237 stop:518 length:282 start_codon:yes stop_codon:yes gene_type:complete
VAGHGSRTGSNGASLRGDPGEVRAGEDGDKGKREEMNHPLPNSKPEKRETVSKPNSRKYLFSLCNQLKHCTTQINPCEAFHNMRFYGNKFTAF